MGNRISYEFHSIDIKTIGKGENKGIYVNKLYFYDEEKLLCHIWGSLELKYGEWLRNVPNSFRQEDEIGEILARI